MSAITSAAARPRLGALLRVAGAALVVLALAAGCAPHPGVPTAGPRAPGTLAWEPCRGQGWPPQARCADMAVPLDHDTPDGPQITIRVSWIPATDQQNKRGLLVSNPGGPGAPGLRNVLLDTTAGSPRLQAATAHYDLVGFDPRGVGESTRLSCGLTPEQGLAVKAPSPSSQGPARDTQIASSIADACRAHGGPLLAKMSTGDTARDLDQLRAALDAPRVTYYGSSYGTYLGIVYDALFPGRLDRVVLDSVVDSEHGWYEQTRRIAHTTEQRFDDFAVWASVHADTARLGTTPAQVRARYLALVDQRRQQPLTLAPDGSAVLDATLIRRATYFLVGRNRFPALAELLTCAAQPAGSPCHPVLARSLGQLQDADETDDTATSAYLAVSCTDSPWPHDPAQYQRNTALDAQQYPITAGGFAQPSPCAFWPVPARPAITAARWPTPPQFLMLNNTHDRISDLDGARATRAALGPRTRLITVAGWNHQIIGNHDPCADRAISAWLGDGTLPADDSACGGA